MKKIFALALALVMISALAACGGETEQDPDAVGFSAADIEVTRGSDTYECDVYIEDIIAAFGEDYAYSEAMSCAYDGMDKVYGYASEFVDFSTRPDGDRDLVCEIYVYGGDWVSSKGIGIGATIDDVVAKYGEPTSSTNFISYYELPASNAESTGASLYFEFLGGDGVVTSFGVVAEQLAWEE